MKAKGFTLIEMLMVIVIIGVLASVVTVEVHTEVTTHEQPEETNTLSFLSKCTSMCED